MITRNVKAVEISRPDADRYNSSFAVKMANFGTLTELCTARKKKSAHKFYCIILFYFILFSHYHELMGRV